MDNKTIISNLKKLQRIKPRSAWMHENRDFLISHVSATSKKEFGTQGSVIKGLQLILQPKRLSLALRPVALAVVAISVTICGFATVSASKNSLPGDTFYSIKRIGEKTQLSLTIGEENKAQLEIEFAGRRSEELNFLIHKKDEAPEKKQKVEQTVKYLKEDVDAAKKRISGLKDTNPKEAVEAAKAMDQKAEELEEDLTTAKNNLVTEEADELQATIDEAIDAVEETEKEVTDVIVEKHVSGEVISEEGEIEDILEEKIDKVQKKATAVKDRISRLNEKLSAEVEKRSAAEKASIPTLPGEETEEPSAEEELSDKIDEVDVKGEDATKILEEADSLIEEKDYVEAAEKIKASEDIVDEAEQALTEIDSSMEEQAPEPTAED